ncbi:hypothetical protein KAR91_49670 [Candidatus Pacearchaeota archaeon]|nr:hypothetical protein [Candidatus Pacearchaeota archaeon]
MKRLLLSLILIMFIVGPAYAAIKAVNNGPVIGPPNKTAYVLNGKIDTGDSDVFTILQGQRTFSAKVVGTGAVTATIILMVSNTGDADDWATAATITLSGTTSDSDGFAMNAKWAYTKANISAISGTDAAVTVTLGV